MVAHLRTFTGIPYAKEIAEACGAEAAFRDILGENPNDALWTAPIVEMRYRAVDMLVNLCGYKNVLELAAGLSPRGLVWSCAHSDGFFVETDLPAVIEEKRKILQGIVRTTTQGNNLGLMETSATNRNHLLLAASAFKGGPITIITEGLLQYLTHEEKRQVAENVCAILQQSGGVWITPDIPCKERMQALSYADPRVSVLHTKVSQVTGRDLQENSFETLQDAQGFFMSVGFTVQSWSQRELVPEESLVSPSRVNVHPRALESMFKDSKIWALTV
jgi:O-methyltransferase involved in polyketide biosynthesis